MSAKPRVLIAARLAPDYTGGLAEYQRQLAAQLEPMAETIFVAMERLANDGPQIPLGKPLILPEPGFHPPLRMWMRLASRPWLHGLLKVWVTRECLRPLNLPHESPQAIHYVGTGWDFFGFAMEHHARKHGARFTVWPAVHPRRWGDDKVDVALYRTADAVICQSDEERRHLIECGVPAKLLRRTGLPPMCRTDGDGSRLRQRLGIGDRPAVLFLGRRDAGKGYDALISAWPMVLERHPRAVLLIAGPEEKGLPALPADSFRDLGIPDEQEKADALSACDAFCLPSEQESFGIVYAEAWSYGKPVVCGTAPASREWIGDAVSGLWSDATPSGIATAVKTLLADPALARRLGDAGRKFQHDHLTWKVILPVHLEVMGLNAHH